MIELNLEGFHLAIVRDGQVEGYGPGYEPRLYDATPEGLAGRCAEGARVVWLVDPCARARDAEPPPGALTAESYARHWAGRPGALVGTVRGGRVSWHMGAA